MFPTIRLLQSGMRVFERTKGELTDPEFRQLMPYFLICEPCEIENNLLNQSAGYLSANTRVYGVTWARTANVYYYDNKTLGIYFRSAHSSITRWPSNAMNRGLIIFVRP
jgi:hypothetical protein